MLMDKTDAWRMQSFAERFHIVSSAHTGKHELSPSKQNEIDEDVARHLAYMYRLLSSGAAGEHDIKNADETHFVVNTNNNRTLGFAGESEIEYADVVSGGKYLTMVIRLGGGRDARFQCPFMVFTNRNCSYLI